MNWVDILCAAMGIAGGFFVLVGGIGALRMPDLFTRMHAASLTDTLGSLLILSALMIQFGLSLATLKLVAIAIFLLFTSPVASYALANAALLSGHRPIVARGDQPDELDLDDLLIREPELPEAGADGVRPEQNR
ncbi:MAG: monovalent cation/H(+) antiporter subunit G [Pseudomonadota bacterium]